MLHPEMEQIMRHPSTELVYITAVSDLQQTVGQTLVQNDSHVIGYDMNVTLTAGALLDGVQRNQDADDDTDTADFLDDVMEEMKMMSETATYDKSDVFSDSES